MQLQVRVEFPEAADALPGEAAADVGVDEHSPAQLAEGGVDGDLLAFREADHLGTDPDGAGTGLGALGELVESGDVEHEGRSHSL